MAAKKSTKVVKKTASALAEENAKAIEELIKRKEAEYLGK